MPINFEEIKQYYDQVYQEHAGESFPFDEKRYRVFLAKVDLGVSPRDNKSLDIGCGVGYICELLQKKGLKPHGIDISQPAIDLARKKCPNGSFSLASQNDCLLYPNEEFELVTCFGVLEHIQDPQRMVSEISRVLKKRGSAIIVVPNKLNPFFWWGGTGQVLEVPRSVCAWAKMFREANLVVESIQHDPGPTPQPGMRLVKRIKYGVHQLFLKLPISLSYQLIFNLKKPE